MLLLDSIHIQNHIFSMLEGLGSRHKLTSKVSRNKFLLVNLPRLVDHLLLSLSVLLLVLQSLLSAQTPNFDALYLQMAVIAAMQRSNGEGLISITSRRLGGKLLVNPKPERAKICASETQANRVLGVGDLPRVQVDEVRRTLPSEGWE